MSVDDYHDFYHFDTEYQDQYDGDEDMSTEENVALPTPSNTNGAAPAASGAASASPVEPGVYDMRAIDADLAFTNGSDSSPAQPQAAVLLEFTDGKYKGTSLTWYGFFTDKTKEGTIRALRLLGWEGDDVSDLSTVRGSAPCVIQVEPDLEGVPRARVRFIGGGALAVKNRMNEDQKKAFAASMKAFASQIKAPEKKPEEGEAAKTGTPTGKTGQKFF